MKGIDIFSTKLFEFQLDQVDSFNILNDILRNKDELKIISSTRQTQSIEEYITDYPYDSDSKSVKLQSLETAFERLNEEFKKYKSTIDIDNYWTAIYIKNGYHSLHDHNCGILSDINYSGILYLSDIGGTTFYSTSPSSFDNRFYSQSKMGKILIFPSSLPHAVEPTNSEENERYIVAFNCRIKNI